MDISPRSRDPYQMGCRYLMVANLFLIRQVNKGTPPLRVEGNLMTNITTFVKHDDLIVNVETRGPIGGTENDYVTKVYFGETEYASPVVVDFFHKGKDVDILQLLKVRGDEKSVILDTRRESLTLP